MSNLREYNLASTSGEKANFWAFPSQIWNKFRSYNIATKKMWCLWITPIHHCDLDEETQ